MLVNVHCLPLRWSSTVRLPPLRPISVRSRPSRPAGVETLDPGEQRGKIGNAVADGQGRSGGRGGWGDGCAGSGLLDPCRRPQGLRRERSGCCRSGDEWTLVAAGEDRDLAVRFDPHRHLGADQAQPLGANAAGQQARAGDADLGLRRARHDGAFGVAHHDVANAQRRAAVRITLELGAADLDLDGRCRSFP